MHDHHGIIAIYAFLFTFSYLGQGRVEPSEQRLELLSLLVILIAPSICHERLLGRRQPVLQLGLLQVAGEALKTTTKQCKVGVNTGKLFWKFHFPENLEHFPKISGNFRKIFM